MYFTCGIVIGGLLTTDSTSQIWRLGAPGSRQSRWLVDGVLLPVSSEGTRVSDLSGVSFIRPSFHPGGSHPHDQVSSLMPFLLTSSPWWPQLALREELVWRPESCSHTACTSQALGLTGKSSEGTEAGWGPRAQPAPAGSVFHAVLSSLNYASTGLVFPSHLVASYHVHTERHALSMSTVSFSWWQFVELCLSSMPDPYRNRTSPCL